MIALADFAPLGLDELVTQAELLRRVDRKYLLPAAVAQAAIAELGSGTGARVLEIDGRRSFAYDSVYFDTEDRQAYRLTAQKRRRRFKLRTRSYLDTGGCFLELKTKSGRGQTVKQRIEYRHEDRARLTERGRCFARELLEVEGHAPELVQALRPKLESRYRRATLLLPEGSRATIDTDLEWRTTGSSARLPGWVILETKSSGGASALDRTLWLRGHRPSGISKFGTGTAMLHPELQHNKWTRVLRAILDTKGTHHETTTAVDDRPADLGAAARGLRCESRRERYADHRAQNGGERIAERRDRR